MGRLGGLAVLNLEGVFSRYANPDEVLDRIVSASQEEATKIIQSIYGEPIKEELIHQRIQEIKKGGGPAVVSSIPQRAERFAQIAQEAGADIFVVQSTVTTARHIATEYKPVDFRKLKKSLAIPLIVGNCVTYEACLELMDTGIDGMLIGVGPGRGLHQPRGARARRAAGDRHRRRRGRPRSVLQADAAATCPIITDGGMTTGGDVCKALRGRRRRRHDRLGVRARHRGAGPRLPLGHGHAARQPAARHAHPGGRGRDRWSRSCSARRSPRTAR